MVVSNKWIWIINIHLNGSEIGMSKETKKENEKENLKGMEVMDLNEDLAETEDLVETEEMEDFCEVDLERRFNEKTPEEKDLEVKQRKKKEFFSLIVTFLLAMAVALVFKNHIIINANVPTGSMENTIMPGDNLFGYRLAYLNEEPQRGDIVFFYAPDDESQKYVKRIIGLPGEYIYITEGKIYIDNNEEPLDEPYLKEEWTKGTGTFVFEVPEGHYFMLGDNRNNSHDARFWINTYVSREKIIGKALFVYYPFDRIGGLE